MFSLHDILAVSIMYICKLHTRISCFLVTFSKRKLFYRDKSFAPWRYWYDSERLRAPLTRQLGRPTPRTATASFVVCARRFLCMIGPLRPVHTSAETQSHPTIGGSRWWWCRASSVLSLFADALFPSSRPCFSATISSSLLFSLPPYSRYELLRARCLDRCGLVGRMVRWLVERPSPDPRPYRSPPSVSFLAFPTGPMPINMLRVYTAVSFRYILTPRVATRSAHLLHSQTCRVDGRLANRITAIFCYSVRD